MIGWFELVWIGLVVLKGYKPRWTMDGDGEKVCLCLRRRLDIIKKKCELLKNILKG